jgi:hypothetical protein
MPDDPLADVPASGARDIGGKKFDIPDPSIFTHYLPLLTAI